MIGEARVHTGIAAEEGKCPMEFAAQVAEARGAAATGLRSGDARAPSVGGGPLPTAAPLPAAQPRWARSPRGRALQGRGPSLQHAQGQEGASTHRAAVARLAATAGKKPSAGLPAAGGWRTCKAT